MTSYYPSNLQWVGLARETTYGTPIAAPTVWVPVTSPKYVSNVGLLPDNALREGMSQDYGQQQGMRHDELTYTTMVYSDSAYLHLLALLGRTDAVSGTADPYTHKSSVENGAGVVGAQPASFTLFFADGTGACWQIPGCHLATLTLSVKVDNPVTLQVGWMGLPANEITAPANTPSTAKMQPSRAASITVAGTALSKYSEVDLAYKRATEVLPNLTGTQTPELIYVGMLQVTGTLVGLYQASDGDVANYLTNTQPSLSVTITPVGDPAHTLTLQHSVVAYDQVAFAGGGDWVEVSAAVHALANATDALDSRQSPVQAIFLSPVATPF